MQRIENPELKRKILNHLAQQYNIKETREPNHLSSYVYCLTKGYMEQATATMPTDDEVMMFALGYGLQDVLTPRDATAPVYESEGIIYRPDMSFSIGQAEIERLTEIKTTRKSAKYHFMDEHIPETWLVYMKGGCFLRGTDKYDLIVLYMMGDYAPPFPQMYCDTFEFTDDEIMDNWSYLRERKEIADFSLANNKIPVPFTHNYDWECKYCRFYLTCQTISAVTGNGGVDPILEDEQENWGES